MAHETKNEIRKRIRALRDAAPADQRAAWSRRICQRAVQLPAYRAAQTIHLFLSFQSEIDTTAIIEDALRAGKRVVVPVFVKDSDETPATEITSLDAGEFTFGKWNLRTPKTLRLVPLAEIDLVFVPMVAFSPPLSESANSPPPSEGGGAGGGGWARIGYGAGFYDTFLTRLQPSVPKIGLAFSLQRVERIPLEPHDVLLDDVMTE
jgi:5-formyltetrahydrofolate cyclo-ligase